MPLAGEDGVPRRGAGGAGDVGVLEEGALARDAVEGGGLDDGVVPVGAGVGPAPVVGDAEEDVGFLCGEGGEGGEGRKAGKSFMGNG